MFTEKLTAVDYTWPSAHNQSSVKANLPEPFKRAITNVAMFTLRGRAETWAALEHKIMKLFSSRRKAVRSFTGTL